MENSKRTLITIEADIQAPVDTVWKLWSSPEDIIRWNNASDDWHTTKAENDLQPGGKFLSRMEAKDGSFGFDFGGVYDTVEYNKLIEYTLGDGRKVKTYFTSKGAFTQMTVIFEAEETTPVEMQRGGWQAILNNFKKYAEANIDN